MGRCSQLEDKVKGAALENGLRNEKDTRKI
jgi:hypothetical protein